MSWYKCTVCGHVFEDGEEKRWTEDYGEGFSGCPCCASGYEEATTCENCGGVYLSDELYGGLCEECIDGVVARYRYDLNGCRLVGKHRQVPVQINCFLAEMFTVKQIEEILFRELVQCSAIYPVDCTEFIEADKGWFIENALKLEKEVKK